MRLSDVLAKYPAFRVATVADNDRILEFFGRVAMDLSSLVLRYDRSPDFFALLRQQAEKAIVLVADGPEGRIAALGTICLRRVYVGGEPVQAGYLSDLRVGPELARRARLQWRKAYAEILEKAPDIEELEGCRYFYSAVLDQNRAAVQALTKPDAEIYYRELARYRSVHLFTRLPWRGRTGAGRRAEKARGATAGKAGFARGALSIDGYAVRRATGADLPRLREFLHRQNRERLFGHVFGRGGGSGEASSDRGAVSYDELDRRLGSWDGLRIESFWVAEDAQGRLAGCVNPWTSHSARRMMAQRVPAYLGLLGRAMPLLGKSAIGAGRALDLLYLSHLELESSLPIEERRWIFRALLEQVFRLPEARRAHLVSFLDWDDESLKPALGRDFLFTEVPATFFQVVHRNRELDWKGLTTRPGRPPAFEISIA
jgi:hypothetical protein